MARRQVVWLGLLSLLSGGLIYEWLKVPALSVATISVIAAAGYEYAKIQASTRTRGIIESWPAVLDSLESAAIAGLSIRESLRDIAESEQIFVTKEFKTCCDQLDAGLPIDKALVNLKSRLAAAPCDFTIELIRATTELGSVGYVDAVRVQAKNLRDQSQLFDQVSAKQGWVVGTAKLAVLAPWLIVTVLSVRPENAAAFSTFAGSLILLLGLAASAVALRLVYRIAGAMSTARVFA